MKLYTGTSGYSYTTWKGPFYPLRLSPKRMLHAYGEQLPAVEINSTFRGLPATSTLEAWAGDVPAGFRFTLKAPQQITHVQRLRDAGDSASRFMAAAAVLEDRLGPLLFQLPPSMKKDLPRLRDFLALLRPPFRAAFEFRHVSWFDDEVFDLLRAHEAALCIADAEGELVVPFVQTATWTCVRLRRPDYDDAALSAWLARLRAQAWDEAYVFFKHDDLGRAPRMALRLRELDETTPTRPG